MEFEEKNDDATTVVKEEEKSSEFSEPTKSSVEAATLSDADLIQLVNCEAHICTVLIVWTCTGTVDLA